MANITRPDFTKIPLHQGTRPRQREKAAFCWMTHEQIPVKSYYAAEDLAGRAEPAPERVAGQQSGPAARA